MDAPPLFAYRDSDARFYRERLEPWLPGRIVDVHVHLWLAEHLASRRESGRTVTWPSRVADRNTAGDLERTCAALFPGRQVLPLVFANLLDRTDDFEAGNRYVAEEAAARGWPALLFARPDWGAEEFERRLADGGFLGAKVYLSLADPALPRNAISILDFLPSHQLEVLDRRQAIVMLHVPRDLRIRDPLNVSQVLHIAERHPGVRLVIAHAGRAYCPEDVGTAFRELAAAREVLFDVSANVNAMVFRRLLDEVGPSRVLFGSDLPITRMRMRRICEAGRYVNLVGRGLYGDVSGDPNMREVPAEEAQAHTFFLYEELDALIGAAREVGLGRREIGAMLFGNAARLLGRCGFDIDGSET